MGWLGSIDIKIQIGATGDEGLPMGGAKYAKWAKKPNIEKIGEDGKKKMKKKPPRPQFLF